VFFLLDSHLIIKIIFSLQYLEAVQMMRKHRVNMNILYDHNPEVKHINFFFKIHIFQNLKSLLI